MVTGNFMTTNYRDRTYSMFNNLLITIMQFTYKYISCTIILLNDYPHVVRLYVLDLKSVL